MACNNRLRPAKLVWWKIRRGVQRDSGCPVFAERARYGGDLFDSSLAIKQQVEVLDPSGRFLIYEDCCRPEPEQDWLLDIRLYAAPFAADRTSMLLQELGLHQHNLREHLKLVLCSLPVRSGLPKLQRLLNPDDDEAALDLKILAVLARG